MKKLLFVAFALLGACGGTDERAPEETRIVGVYASTGPIEVIALYPSHAYVICKHDGACVAAGRYAYDHGAQQLELTDSATQKTTVMPAHVAALDEAMIAPRDFLNPGGPLTTDTPSELTKGASRLVDMNGPLVEMSSAILCRQDPVNILMDPSQLQPGERVFDDIQAAMDAITSPLLACRDGK